MRKVSDVNISEDPNLEMDILNQTKVKKRKKTGKEIRKTIAMGLLFTAIGSVGVYAWFTLSNKARIENLSLLADHQGNLLIADDKGRLPADGEYSSALDLTTAIDASELENKILSPVTTKDGKAFFAPVYDAGSGTTDTVIGVSELTDKEQLRKFYIFEKTFYLKAGSDKNDEVANISRKYEVALYGTNGSYIYQRNAEGNGVMNIKDSAANSIRVSFTLDDANGTTSIYEPNSDISSDSNNRAQDNVKTEYGLYKTLKQKADGNFVVSPKTNQSEVLFTIPENTPTKVTMRIWIEGTDLDCVNEIVADRLVGQIQFVSTEIKEDRPAANS